jgi:diaminohydroxyphosphoribosylaminopyrimidine deaminase/5-amino-6-(5-phosphoribosylamino)uracil reductase
MVGAVLVRAGKILARGFHAKFGAPHAEIAALDRADGRGADLYVTLEPCVSFAGKKTPSCADRVARSGVARVIVGSIDPNPKVGGRGIARLKKSGIDVVTGILARENERLNGAFFKRQRTGLPYVVCKWAMTLDGKIATSAGRSKWITSAAARKEARALRRKMRAVLVGSGTVLADDPRLQGVTRIVLDSWARTPLDSHIVRTARRWRTILAVSSSAPEDRVTALRRAGAEVQKFEVLDLKVVLERVGAPQVLIEGGGEIHASALDAGVVDEVVAFVAPIIVGGRAAKSPVEGDGRSRISDALRLKEVQTRILPTGELIVRGRPA